MTTAIKERPILLSASMVRAVIENRKTETRRPITGKQAEFVAAFQGDTKQPDNEDNSTIRYVEKGHAGPGFYVWDSEYPEEGGVKLECPYGQPGDRLWVRETWTVGDHMGEFCGMRKIPTERPAGAAIAYYENYNDPKAKPFTWRPSIHMPRWASRITLEITGVSVERLWDITALDIEREGAIIESTDIKKAISVWIDLWSSIYSVDGPNGWPANPWVWVISFRRVTS